jgi:hypothetical protein
MVVVLSFSALRRRVSAHTTRTAIVVLDVTNFGAARGIRTPDPIITNDVLYRLSYCGFRRDLGVGTQEH